MRILYHYFLLTVFLLFNVPDVGASRQLFAIHPVIYPYPVEPMEYPEYSRRPYPLPQEATDANPNLLPNNEGY